MHVKYIRITPMQKSTKKCRSVGGFDDTAVPDAPYLLDRKKAAFMLSLSLRSIDYLIAEGRLRTRRIGGRILLPTADLIKSLIRTGSNRSCQQS
jgi:hypothetical protein